MARSRSAVKSMGRYYGLHDFIFNRDFIIRLKIYFKRELNTKKPFYLAFFPEKT